MVEPLDSGYSKITYYNKTNDFLYSAIFNKNGDIIK